MSAATFLIEQQRRRYASQLQSWVSWVRSARSCEDALRVAYNRPVPGSLLAGVRSLIASDERHYSQQADACLMQRLNAATDDTERRRCAHFATRLTWAPSVARWGRSVNSQEML